MIGPNAMIVELAKDHWFYEVERYPYTTKCYYRWGPFETLVLAQNHMRANYHVDGLTVFNLSAVNDKVKRRFVNSQKPTK